MISVIIPTYNEAENIEDCLISLNNQTLPRDSYEIIVVDGGSADNTIEIAQKYADLVFIQESPKVGGARNDGALRARYDIIATTDADTILPSHWLEQIHNLFCEPAVVQVFGPVTPKEKGLLNMFYLSLANNFARLGYYTKLFYFTLGCNTAFRKNIFLEAGMYRMVDAGDDLEIPRRMIAYGKIVFCEKLKIGFSMRRYSQFGALRSIYEWMAIVFHGGDSRKYQYTKRNYR